MFNLRQTAKPEKVWRTETVYLRLFYMRLFNLRLFDLRLFNLRLINLKLFNLRVVTVLKHETV